MIYYTSHLPPAWSIKSWLYYAGFFHKRHAKKSGGATLANYSYTCHRCQNGVCVQIDVNKGVKRGGNAKLRKPKNVIQKKELNPSPLKSGKVVATRGRPPKSKAKIKKKAPLVVPLRRSARKAKCIILQKKKQRGRKKGKQIKPKKLIKEKPKKVTSKRSNTSCSYWLNGLQFSRKLNDERVLLFRSKRFLVPSDQSSAAPNKPTCQLCDEAEHASTLNYISCEICEGRLVSSLCGTDFFHNIYAFFNIILSH